MIMEFFIRIIFIIILENECFIEYFFENINLVFLNIVYGFSYVMK